MCNIIIPERLQSILNKDVKMAAKTQTAINNISEIISKSDLYFFPEYTNHGMEHIINIFSLIDKIAPTESLNELSPKAVSSLVLSVYLHDLGMYLKPDGLKQLLSQEPWQNEYNKYIKAAQRMSDIDLKKLYGDSAGFVIPPDLNDRLELSDRHKLTYGDFLRRNHGAIAEYIAINGMPGNTKTELFEDFDDEHKKIIGLIAKSHTLPIRTAAKESNKLMGKENLYRPSNVPIVYLMVLLRIGDILDIGKDRAPHIIYNMQRFSSPISKEEWEWNQTIDPTDFNWDTPKTLYIQSDPKNTVQFVKIENNLKWFQSELDFSWAALCDCYGSTFNLTIHRMESNIFEQKEEFKKKFLTKEAKIRITSNLSKLLVDPLYHGDPIFAVRELLQNAVDACNLRKEIERRKGNSEYKGKILVHIDTTNKVFTIKDNGTGMNEDVITNYYLTVGANFRNSSYWNEKISDKVDEDNVVRAGRFGVGFLAAFLIGDIIQVTTRHLDDKNGYKFNVTLDDEQVDVKITNGLEFGTEIKIPMKDIKSLLNDKERRENGEILWNEWYHNETPEVCYMVDDKIVIPELNYKIPDDVETSSNWRSIESYEFRKVSYGIIPVDRSKIFDYDCNNFLSNIILLNGFLINVNENTELKAFYPIMNDKNCYYKAICSIVDDKNCLGINLSRTKLDQNNDIFKQINTELWKWQIARFLCCNISIRKETNTNNILYGIIVKKNFFSIIHPYFLKRLNLNEIYIQTNLIEKYRYTDIRKVINSGKAVLIDGFFNGFPSAFCSSYKRELHFKTLELFGLLSGESYISDYDNFRLLKIDKIMDSEDFLDSLDDIFSDVEDLWIPFDFEERKKKFKKAFQVLAKYTENGELELDVTK